MPFNVQVQFQMGNAAVLHPERVDGITRQTIYPAMTDAVLLLEREVKSRTPVGATGAARGSIQSAVELTRGRVLEVRGIVTSALPYIVPLEKGSKPHMVPIEALQIWARSKGKGDDFAAMVQDKIAKHGTKGKFMFRKGQTAAAGRIERILNNGVTLWARRLGG